MKKSIIMSGVFTVFLATLSVPLIMAHSTEVPKAEFSGDTEKTESAESPEIVGVQKSGRLISSEISALELHNNFRPVYTMDEANAVIEKGKDDYYSGSGVSLVDVSAYAEKIVTATDGEINSLENKSFIYHMMLNSVDYFDTAEGSLVCTTGYTPVNAEFSTNIPESYAYESQKSEQNTIDTYVYDGMSYTVTDNSTCDISYWGEPVEFNISDNERLITLDDGGSLAVNRNDLTHLPMSSSCCLFPQGYAMSRMSDFDTWGITGHTEFLQKDCAVIEGTFDGGSFTMYVDVNHGSMLKYEEYSCDGVMTGYIEATSLEYNSDVEKVIFDENSLNK